MRKAVYKNSTMFCFVLPFAGLKPLFAFVYLKLGLPDVFRAYPKPTWFSIEEAGQVISDLRIAKII